MRTWDVPAVDTANKCSVAWSDKLGGFFLRTDPPEGDAFASDAFGSVPALMVATMPAVDWERVPAWIVAQLHEAPTLAYLDAEHGSVREQVVARRLKLSLAS